MQMQSCQWTAGSDKAEVPPTAIYACLLKVEPMLTYVEVMLGEMYHQLFPVKRCKPASAHAISLRNKALVHTKEVVAVISPKLG